MCLYIYIYIYILEAEGATRPHQLLLESCLKEYVFLLVHFSLFRASVMRDLAQPIAPSALSAFRTVGRGGASRRTPPSAAFRGGLRRSCSEALSSSCDIFAFWLQALINLERLKSKVVQCSVFGLSDLFYAVKLRHGA